MKCVTMIGGQRKRGEGNYGDGTSRPPLKVPHSYHPTATLQVSINGDQALVRIHGRMSINLPWTLLSTAQTTGFYTVPLCGEMFAEVYSVSNAQVDATLGYCGPP